MARHWTRVLVKWGEWDAFRAALKAHNDDAARVGMAEYRAWSPRFGPFGEAFLEGEYASVDEMHARIASALNDAQFMAKVNALFSHVVPGTAADWDLELKDLG